jgi:hypothetical protein
MNSLQFMATYVAFLVAAVGIILFLTRTRHH